MQSNEAEFFYTGQVMLNNFWTPYDDNGGRFTIKIMFFLFFLKVQYSILEKDSWSSKPQTPKKVRIVPFKKRLIF